MLTRTKSKIQSKIDQSSLTFDAWSSAEELPSEWGLVQSELLFSKTFFKAIEVAQPKGMRFLYLGAKNQDGVLMAIFYFQLVPFQAHESLNYEREELPAKTHCPSFFARLQQLVKTNIARKIEFETLVLGNLLLTGNYGSRFSSVISREEHQAMMERAINWASNYLQKSFLKHAPVLLVKEFYSNSNTDVVKKFGNDLKWHGFRIAPNHVFVPSQDWTNMDHYLETLSSKYRVRYRRAIKKLEHLLIQELSLEELLSRKKELYSLYLQIAGNAGFNMVNLTEDYLYVIKKHLGDDFKVFGFYQQEQLCGFFSYFESNEQIDVHYIGLDNPSNIAHQLYLNMLYFIIEKSIDNGGKRVNFGRTAPEIKSSVGARTFHMDCYIRHDSPLVQKLISPLIRFLQPDNSWEERHPFKESSTD